MENQITLIVFIILAINIFRLVKKFKGNSLELNKDFFLKGIAGQNKNQALVLDDLGRAIQKKDVDKIFNLFIEQKNVNVQKVYNTGETPLMLAVKTTDPTIVKILLDKGAYINVKDKAGNSPLSLAQKMGDKNIESFLLSTLKKRQRLAAEGKIYE